MKGKTLIDTNILIDAFEGDADTISILNDIETENTGCLNWCIRYSF